MSNHSKIIKFNKMEAIIKNTDTKIIQVVAKFPIRGSKEKEQD